MTATPIEAVSNLTEGGQLDMISQPKTTNTQANKSPYQNTILSDTKYKNINEMFEEIKINQKKTFTSSRTAGILKNQQIIS